MRYVRVFLLTFQHVLEERTRSFVWFVISIINPLIMLLFWRGANISQGAFSAISSYYFLLMIGGSLLMSHSEENVGLLDIQEGRLGSYLLKPFTYFISKWLEELPYRLLQGTFGITTVLLFILVFHIKLSILSLNILNILLCLLIIIAGICLAQVYKMCLAFICFWTTDVYGIFQLPEILIFILSGYILPISFYPHSIAIIAYILPFTYIIYFPVASVAGFFSTMQLLLILSGQIAWLGIFAIVYKVLWRNGVKAFTGVGQ